MALMDHLAGKEPAKRDGFTAEQRFFLGLGPDLVREHAPEESPACAPRPIPTRPASIASTDGLQYAGVSKGVRLRCGSADGAQPGVPGLVTARYRAGWLVREVLAVRVRESASGWRIGAWLRRSGVRRICSVGQDEGCLSRTQ